jgi:SprT-like family
MTFSTREEWLTQGVEELRPIFALHNKPLPQKIRVACGFPLDAKRSKAIGQCWADTASADHTIEILISPTLDNPVEVFEVLVHELCHATAGAMNHGVNFQKIAGLMHLTPVGTGREQWKSTRGHVPFFSNDYTAIIDSLEAYPHSALTFATKKTQGTRMFKALCPSCGYTVRLTQKWVAVGMPTCPCGDTLAL